MVCLDDAALVQTKFSALPFVRNVRQLPRMQLLVANFGL